MPNLREALIKKIESQRHQSTSGALPVVTLEDFFEGNEDYASIGCNLTNHPGPRCFYETLKAIRDEASVQDVLVEINEVVEDDPQTWPFSDRVYILSGGDINQLRYWLAPLHPDDISEGWAHGTPSDAPILRPEVKVYALWWD